MFQTFADFYFCKCALMRNVLTTLGIERVGPRAIVFEIPDAKIIGLRLVVQPSGFKSWAVRYRHHGRNRKLTLGPYPRIALDQARKLASAALRGVAEGNDPAGEKSEARRRMLAGLEDEALFGASWDRYISEYVRPNLKASSANEIERLGTVLILPKFRKRRLAEIKDHDIKALMLAQKKRGAPIQANKVFTTLRAFLNWCRRELILRTESPCTGLQKPEVEKPRDRVLTDQEIKWLWRACDEIGFPFGPMVKLLLLTAARREEARAMTGREIDRTTRLWTLPPARVKNGREHSIYLADAALAVLDASPRIRGKRGLVFTVTGETPCSGFSRAKTRLDALMTEYAGQEIAPWVIHDLRRTVASGMARLRVSLPVIERCLNHISGSFGGIVGVYQRHEFADEKQTAFESWARHVELLLRDDSEVVILRPRRAS